MVLVDRKSQVPEMVEAIGVTHDSVEWLEREWKEKLATTEKSSLLQTPILKTCINIILLFRTG